jgi:hypothetical protein
MPNYTDKDIMDFPFYVIRKKGTRLYRTGTKMQSVPKLYALGSAKAHVKKDEEIVPLLIFDEFPINK